MAIDFAAESADYARKRTPFVQPLFDRLQDDRIIWPGQTVLDVAAGNGLFGAMLIGRGCDVILTDHAPHLLRNAAGHLRKVAAAAESLPFVNAAFQIITVANAWHWLDRIAAPLEIKRVCAPGGALLIVYQTHIPLPGSIAEDTERIILRHRPGWRHANSTGINGQALRDVQAAGFVDIESFSFDVEIRFSPTEWYAVVRTLSPVGPSMTGEQLLRFDAEFAELLRGIGQSSFHIPHRVFAVVARKPPRGL